MVNSPNERSTAGEKYYPKAAVGWYSTIVLALLYWLSILDRSIIALMVDPIKQDLGISDVQFGMLHGLAFAITFSLFGLVAGALTDRFSRRKIVFVSVTIWSAATAACGMAQNFVHLLIARIGVGAGEAGLNPSATSMITDLFPPSKLTFALAVYAIGASFGAGCAYLFGGILVDLVSTESMFHLPVIGEVRPWQAVFYIIGIPGIAIAFLAFSMPEPKRHGVRSDALPRSTVHGLLRNYGELLTFIAQRRRFFLFHYAGFGCASLSFVGASAWYPAHMGRTFGVDATQIGFSLGITLVIAGICGKFLCGYFVDKLYQRGYRDAQFRWYASCLVAAVPLAIVANTSDSYWIFLIGLGAVTTLLSPVAAVYVASLNLVTPNELRGAGVAFYGATIGLAALSLGPIMIAAVSDYGFGGNAIGYGIATMFAVFCPVAAILLYRGCSAMREAVKIAESWEYQEKG